MDNLLKLKHWILFTIMMVPSAIVEIADLSDFWNSVSVMWFMSIFACWLFAVGNAVYNRESTSRFAVGLFRAGIIYLLICQLIIFYRPSDPSNLFQPWFISFFTVTMLFELYLFYFVAKHLVQYEIEQDLETKSIFLTFCLIWVFPIGVFFIQPRVNRIMRQNLVSTA